MERVKCNSCKNKYNGTNGNGYQPCDCAKNKDTEKKTPPKKPKFSYEGWGG